MSTINDELAAVLQTVQTPGSFFAGGVCAMHSPSLQVAGVGPVALPLLASQALALIAAAERAPYGRGEDTVVDTTVRRTWQIGAEQLQIEGKGWAQTLQTVTDRVATALGAGTEVGAELYKLLVYDEGSFFVNHRDTEKTPRMFGTLIIGLPSLHAGGDLLVRHRGQEARLSLRVADPSELAYAAFYADCVHEVLPITSGYRLALVYNLVRTGSGRAPQAPNYEPQTAALAQLLKRWASQAPDENTPQQLVYPLDHAYTPAELSFQSLKGADAAGAAVLATASEQAGCELHLALMQIEQSGSAEYGGGGRSRGWRRYHDDDDDEGEDEVNADFTVGEMIDCTQQLSHWQTPQGQGLALQHFPFHEEEVCPANALQNMEPDEQHFHEATGNEGATFERSYQRAALVMWPRKWRVQVLQRAGVEALVAYLAGLVSRWNGADGGAGTGARDALWAEAQELVSHAVDHWPSNRSGFDNSGGEGTASNSPAADLLLLLCTLQDVPHLHTFITHLAHTRSYSPGDNAALVQALALLPADSAGPLLSALIARHADLHISACADLVLRASAAPALKRGWQNAARCLVDTLPGNPAQTLTTDAQSLAWRRQKPDATLLCNLMRLLCRTQSALAQQVLEHCLAWPQTYDLDTVIVPAARTLLDSPALREQGAVLQLVHAAKQHLHARVSLPLDAPQNWARPARLPCHCPHCAGLSQFLENTSEAVWRFKAKESDREHVHGTIKSAHCDVDCSTERKGSPHVLVCTKNQASFERRVQQRQADLQSLGRLA